jgi:phosphate-selective porin OprO and OprP
MTSTNMLALLLATTVLTFVTPAAAQTAAAPQEAQPLADARTELLEAQIQALQKQLDDLKAQVTKVTPSWKGAPQFADEKAGWSFKPRGRLQYDAGYISEPNGFTANRNLGFNSRVRRIRLGAEGTIPGGFGYKFDVDFANAAVGFGDVYLTYTSKGKTFGAKIGNQETFTGLDQMTSSNYISFLERAQVNDAFLNNRRLGASAGFRSKDEVIRFDVGLFAAHTIDSSIDNEGFIAGGRFTASPKALGGMLHIGANLQYRDYQSNDNGVASNSVGAPSINQIARFRARPFLQTTDVRFVDTGSFAAKNDLILGAELAGIFGPLYFASEAQLNKVNAYRAGDIATGRDAFVGGSVVTPTGDPSFFSAYGEIGYFLTGETRGYKEGLFNRTKVNNPLSKGGSGSFELIGRIDYLDLDSAKIKNGATNNFANGTSTLAALNSRLARGGKQTGYLFGLAWMPQDYVRFLVNYIHAEIEGGPFAATAKPLSTRPIDQRKYSVDGFAVRAQVDF